MQKKLFIVSLVILLIGLMVGPIQAQEPDEEEDTGKGELTTEQMALQGASNLVFNGNFEDGYRVIPELGIEAYNVGNVPIDWEWFRSNAYGKYTIDNNEGFGLVCPEDPTLTTIGKNSLTFHIQSTDEPDLRLGIYQTMDVTRGRSYLFSMNGAIQVQQGGSSPDTNNKLEVAIIQGPAEEWHEIPRKQWTILPWKEQLLEFKISGPQDPDLAKIEDYYEVVEAQADQVTIYIAAWRRWPNWRTSVFTVDCVSLAPLEQVDMPTLVPRLSELSTTVVDEALTRDPRNMAPPPAAQPAAAVQTESMPAAAPDGEPAAIPPSGGILEAKESPLLIGSLSILTVLVLVGAGLWNIQRRKRADKG